MTTTRDGTDPAAGTATPAPEPRPDEQAPEPLTSGLPQLVRLLGTVVAPTTLLTSLLFYFGWSHAYYFYDYFGVNSTLLGLTTRDYVQKAVDGLFIPMMVVAASGSWPCGPTRCSRPAWPRGRIRGCCASSPPSRPWAWCWRSVASGASSWPRRCDATSTAPPPP
jgi:hypothetical protein